MTQKSGPRPASGLRRSWRTTAAALLLLAGLCAAMLAAIEVRHGGGAVVGRTRS